MCIQLHTMSRLATLWYLHFLLLYSPSQYIFSLKLLITSNISGARQLTSSLTASQVGELSTKYNLIRSLSALSSTRPKSWVTPEKYFYFFQAFPDIYSALTQYLQSFLLLRLTAQCNVRVILKVNQYQRQGFNRGGDLTPGLDLYNYGCLLSDYLI